ncbi:hypothetical protein C8J56DRAFT_1027761 [Mycena floridula]|nr:hypothetical protein C8J56DRAFT_1027761 [Mycena floridula]
MVSRRQHREHHQQLLPGAVPVPSSDRCEAFLTVTSGHASGKTVMLLPTWCLLCFLLYCVSCYHRLLRVKLSCGSTCSRVSKPPDWHQEDQKVPYPDVWLIPQSALGSSM